ncbi:hypothetical protein KP509_36G053100 [Ceratopteris richardii]|nr:hypothetical protein KP509_36G053100 [Ceratopteris richardii]
MEGSRRPDEFVIISIEDVYTDAELDTTGECCSIHSNKLQRLQSLFKLVQDPTGKEDLLEHLRMQALQQFARKHGYTRLVLGLSASRIAVKVISETAKGCGFSLPAGMQYYDGRWSVPVVLPLRDCIAKELVLLCHYRKLKWVFIPNMSTLTLPQKSITSLSSSFVSTLQEDNPSRERTIMRTAAKLQAFSFNHATAIDGHSSHKKSASVPISAVIDEKEEIKDELLCLLCCAPLSPQESVSIVTAFQITESKRQQNGSLISDTKPSTHFLEKCCQSCQYQFFPVEERTGEILSILPQTMKNSEFLSEKVKQMWMRSQINDCLLINSDSDDETVT